MKYWYLVLPEKKLFIACCVRPEIRIVRSDLFIVLLCGRIGTIKRTSQPLHETGEWNKRMAPQRKLVLFWEIYFLFLESTDWYNEISSNHSFPYMFNIVNNYSVHYWLCRQENFFFILLIKIIRWNGFSQELLLYERVFQPESCVETRTLLKYYFSLIPSSY